MEDKEVAQVERIKLGITSTSSFTCLDEEQLNTFVQVFLEKGDWKGGLTGNEQEMRLLNFKAGEEIISQNDIGQNFYVIEDGMVEVIQGWTEFLYARSTIIRSWILERIRKSLSR